MRTEQDQSKADARPKTGSGFRRDDGIALAVLAVFTYVPLFLSHHGRLNADTKQYLYLDPGGLLASAPNLWNLRVSGGTVTHQNIGYLWPMGPYFWLGQVLGIPDWVTQRFWMGTIMFAAAAGAYLLFRALWGERRAATIGALVYGLSPFVLGHITGQSALLLPFSALPWLIVAVRNGLRANPWRWAAIFALITTTAGSLNGSSIFFVIFGAVLWIPYAVWWERSATLRDGVKTLLRIGLLTFVTQLWWLIAYRVGGAYGLPILQVTETVRETSSSTSAFEVFRGLGYWFFYGSDNQGPWLKGVAPPFTQSLPLLAVSFGAPLACVALGWWTRFRERAFFLGLAMAGLLMSTIAFGGEDRSPVGGVFESLSRDSGLVLSLRNTQRAAALLVLGLAGLAAAGLAALVRKHHRLGLAAGIFVLVATLLTFASPWSSALIANRYDRPEAIPQAWVDAAAFLDDAGGRAMLVPGIDFATYRWGNTLDPVLAALTRAELIWRELLPMGGEPGADLMAAFDESIQEGWFDPRTVVPVAQALGVRHIVVANDLEIERYRIQRPEVVMNDFLDPASGLILEAAFGKSYVNRNPGRPIVDDVELRTQYSSETALPQVAIFSVPGVSSNPVTVYPTGFETVVHGDGAGILAAAAAGMVDIGHQPLLSGSDLFTWPAARRAARGAGARHIVTDSNRKQVRRFPSLRENNGATEAADDTPHSGVETDVTAEELNGGDPRAQTVVELVGASSIDASAYGNIVSLTPEDRPTNAFDGDLRTAWRVDVPPFRPVQGTAPHFLRIDLGRRISPDHIDLIQPQGRPGSQPIVALDVVLDGERVFPARVDSANPFDPAGTRVELDGKPFSTLEIRVPDAHYSGLVGFAEVVIPGVEVEELVRLPKSLDALGEIDQPFPLAYLFTRLRANPSEPFRMDPELALRRAFTVPVAMPFALSGTARLNPHAADDILDRLLGSTPAGSTFTSTAHLLGDFSSRASAAVDGDPTSAWTTPLDDVVGHRWTAQIDQGFRIPALTFDVAVDEEHSRPTKLGITVDGAAQVFDVPALATNARAGSVERVTFTPAQPLVGRQLTIEVLEVDPRTGPNLYGDELVLPVSLAEIGVAPTALATASTHVVLPCRDDLMTIDGAPVSLRIDGDIGAAGDGRLAVARCDGAPLALAEGNHVIRTAAGLTTGIDLDALEFVSPQFLAAPSATNRSAGAIRRLNPRVVRSAERSATIAGHSAPYWLRLNQSYNPGWKATAKGRSGSEGLGEAHPIGGFASGWFVSRRTEARTTIDFLWAPQRSVDIALAISAAGVIVCLGLVVFTRRRTAIVARRSQPELATDPFAPKRPSRSFLVGAAVVVVAGTAFGSPAIGVALVIYAVAAAFTPCSRVLAVAVRAAPLVALGAATAFVWAKQARNDYLHNAIWPTAFDLAHVLTLFGFLALALLVWADRDEDLHEGSSPNCVVPDDDARGPAGTVQTP